MMSSPPSIAWLPWNADAFARARTQHRRILLWIGTTWSAGCREMGSATYADPRVVAEIAAHFIPVRVDADERPDIAERYDLGGWPTTAILDQEGTLLGGGTFVPAERLQHALARMAATADAMPFTPPRTGATAADAAPRDPGSVLAMVEGLCDLEHGGSGGAPKFPHAAPVRLALRRTAADADERAATWALRSLEAMGWGPLSSEDGGFFHYCDGADWSGPRPEKLLTINASLLTLFVEAAVAGHGHRFLDRARAAAAFIDRDLRRADGAWRVAAGTGPARVRMDANAAAVSAMLGAAQAFTDGRFAARLLHTLDDLLLASYTPGEGIAHCGGGVRGLLTDQAAMAAACLDAWEACGQLPYRMMAEELVHYALRTMWDGADGGFFDRAPAVAATDPPATPRLKPFVLNCDAAIVLSRLATATGDDAFAGRARETLAAIAPQAMAQGPLAAHYLLARLAVDGAAALNSPSSL